LQQEKNFLFAGKQCAGGIHSQAKFVTMALVTLPKKQASVMKFLVFNKTLCVQRAWLSAAALCAA